MPLRFSPMGSSPSQDDPRSASTAAEKLLQDEAKIESGDISEDEDEDEVTVGETMAWAPLYVNGPYWRTMAELAEKAGRADLAAPIRNLPNNFGTDHRKHDLYLHDQAQKDDFAKAGLRIDEAVRRSELGDRSKIVAALQKTATSTESTANPITPCSGPLNSTGMSPHPLDFHANNHSRSQCPTRAQLAVE
jgi:hypothetical protein